MAYKCRICGVNDVDNPGDMCELCAIGQDPYAQNQTTTHSFPVAQQNNTVTSQGNTDSYSPKKGPTRKVLLGGGTSLANRDPYGNDMTPASSQPPVQVYSAGQMPQAVQQKVPVTPAAPSHGRSRTQPITTGIIKNISIDSQKQSAVIKWFRTLFTGTPFSLDEEIVMFQVFPDFSGTCLNATGNACDQVIVYGKLNKGAICDNNEVEIYGHRDSHNNIIAKTIKNVASGTTITPSKSMGPGAVWFITLMMLTALVTVVMGLGVEGIIWGAVIILCLTNLPTVLKVVGGIIAVLFSFLKRLF